MMPYGNDLLSHGRSDLTDSDVNAENELNEKVYEEVQLLSKKCPYWLGSLLLSFRTCRFGLVLTTNLRWIREVSLEKVSSFLRGHGGTFGLNILSVDLSVFSIERHLD